MAWLWDHRASTRHSLEVQIVTKQMGIDAFLDARLLGGLMAGVPNRFHIDWPITAMVAVAQKQPGTGFPVEAAPLSTECRE